MDDTGDDETTYLAKRPNDRGSPGKPPPKGQLSPAMERSKTSYETTLAIAKKMRGET
jgi:hypothetical protein